MSNYFPRGERKRTAARPAIPPPTIMILKISRWLLLAAILRPAASISKLIRHQTSQPYPMYTMLQPWTSCSLRCAGVRYVVVPTTVLRFGRATRIEPNGSKFNPDECSADSPPLGNCSSNWSMWRCLRLVVTRDDDAAI